MEILKGNLKGDELTVYVFGRIDSTDSSDYEKAIFAEKKKKHSKLILDFSGVSYISSAGLRVILKLAKSEKELRIINVSNDVYNVFEMTGFTQIVHVSKTLREISIEGCPLIGRGAYGRVYRLNGDTVIKSYYRGNPVEDIERERELAKEAFVLGIPTAISYDVVKVKEECFGAVYEMIDSDSLLSCLQKHPENYKTYVKYYVNLLNTLRTTSTEDERIPYATKDIEHRLELIKPVTESGLYKAIAKKLSTLKDKNIIVHGDCHFKNVFVTNEGLLLIDMDTICKGDPILELANLYRTYVCFEEIDPGNIMKFFQIDPDFTKQLFFDVYEGLIEKDREAYLTKIRFLAYFLLLSHYAEKKEKYPEFIEKVKAILVDEVEKFKSF